MIPKTLNQLRGWRLDLLRMGTHTQLCLSEGLVTAMSSWMTDKLTHAFTDRRQRRSDAWKLSRETEIFANVDRSRPTRFWVEFTPVPYRSLLVRRASL